MNIAKTHAVSLIGLTGEIIEVEADISSNLPSFVLVGLPDASLSEATSRVRSACQNSGLSLPARRITVNLSPASVPKFGSSFDLAIAVSILVASGQLPASAVEGCLFVGELALDGSVKPVNGVLPATLAAAKRNFQKVVVPAACYAEAKLVEQVEVLPLGTLRELARVLSGEQAAVIPSGEQPIVGTTTEPKDLSDVIGQPDAVEALVVAAAGGHHISLIGSPGSGKTMLAERLPTILPELTLEQAIESTAIRSLLGKAGSEAQLLSRIPQFQAPHHSASMAAIIGGGTGMPRPGAVSLAHRGVLFLDELLEFQNHVIQCLREPLESRTITISRSAGQAVFPAAFQLVVAANPCACGNFGVAKLTCTCNAAARQRYANRLSGPVFDRIDIRLQVQPVSAAYAQLKIGQEHSLTSNQARYRVIQARAAARERLSATRFETNQQVSASYLRSKLKLSNEVTRDLIRALESKRISMRGFDRVQRLAWTLCDLDGATSPTAEHIFRAMNLRGNDHTGVSK